MAMIYYALVSLVPLLLLLLSAMGLLLRWSDTASTLEQQALSSIEQGFGAELRSTIEHLLRGLLQQSVIASIVSLVGLLLTASLLVKHLRQSVRAIWKYPPILTSGSLRTVVLTAFLEKLLSLGMVLGVGAVMLLAFALVAAVNWLTRRFSGEWELVIPSSLVIVPLTLGVLFRHLPPERLPWRHVWLAAVLCGGAWLATVKLLTLYGAYFSRNLTTYGAFGAILVIMLWMNVVSQGLFFGAEICKVIAQSDPRRPPGARNAPLPVEQSGPPRQAPTEST